MYAQHQPSYASRYTEPLPNMGYDAPTVQALSTPSFQMPSIPITQGVRPSEEIGAGVGSLIGAGSVIAMMYGASGSASPTGLAGTSEAFDPSDALAARGFSSKSPIGI